jgi:hypothetical protein
VKTVQQRGNYEYVIDEIKAINPNVGIDDYVNIINDKGSYSIPFEMNEKFFQYYRRMDADKILEGFGSYIQIYHNYHKGTLFFVDKFNNFISLGDQLMQGNVEVSNVRGLKLTNIKDDTSASLVNHKDDISFMIDCMNPSTDIVIPKGLRMNHQPAELIIQKPGEADGGPNKIVIPYRTDLTNLTNILPTLESGCGSGSGEGGNLDYIIKEVSATNSYV